MTSHLPFKIVSVLLALILYLFVMQDKEGERSFRVPVVVQSEPENYVLLSEVPELQVTVAGRTRNLARIQENQLSELVLNFTSPTTHRRFTASDFELPPGLEVISIYPEIIQLNFAPKDAKEVPVIIHAEGEPPPGYTYTATASPPTIRIEGPEDGIASLQEIHTQPIDVSDLTEDGVRRAALVRLEPNFRYDRDIQVLVSFHMDINWTTLRLTDVPITVSGPEDRFSLDHEFLSVRLRGPQTVIDVLDRSRIRASIDGTDFLESPSGTYDVQPSLLNLPDDVTVEEVDFDTLRLTVTAPSRIEMRYLPLPNLLPIPFPTLGR